MVCNTVLGSLIAYGMGNLNHSGRAIVLSALLLVIGALGAMQLLAFCTLAAPNSDLVSAHAHKDHCCCASVALLCICCSTGTLQTMSAS